MTVMGVYEHRQGVQTRLHLRNTANVRWTASTRETTLKIHTKKERRCMGRTIVAKYECMLT